MQHIILIGLPGSGKTSAGQRLARRFCLPFVDADQVFEAQAGQSITSYFAQYGEAAFREQETATLRNILAAQEPCVLSTGGGAVLRAENRALLKAGGIVVVYLLAQPDAIYQRLRNDTQRPLLQVADPRAKINTLFEERDALYRETAHLVVETGRNSLSAQVRKIAEALEQAGWVAGAGNAVLKMQQ